MGEPGANRGLPPNEVKIYQVFDERSALQSLLPSAAAVSRARWRDPEVAPGLTPGGARHGTRATSPIRVPTREVAPTARDGAGPQSKRRSDLR